RRVDRQQARVRSRNRFRHEFPCSLPPTCISYADTVQRAQRAHSLARELGIDQQAGGVGEPEQLDKMKKIAGALLAADHDEMFLPAVYPSEKNHAGLIEPGRRTEHMA